MRACENPVLLVEDEDDVREILRDVLERRGFVVVEAVNGQAALDFLAVSERRPCLIVLDLIMPVMDGWTLLAALESHPEWADIPVVVSSSLRDRLPKDRPLLPKPVDLKTFLKVVEASCQG